MESDSLILQGCIKGDKQSFKALYDKYSSKMLAVSMRYFSDKMQAEDILHDAWLKVFEKIESFKSEGSLEGWLKKIVANQAITQIRKDSKVRNTPFNENHSNFHTDHADYQPDDFYDDDELAYTPEQLLEALHQLPGGYRNVFNLYVFEKMKHREIAELLSISESTSKTQLLKARALLKKKLLIMKPNETYSR
jgi:RNA polymerase sigma factor (sigma-70 family)